MSPAVTNESMRSMDDPTTASVNPRALAFGAAASAYDRFRPGYPDELFDLVEDYAGGPIRTALEIGAGTGKATRLFAAHGVTVTATEPDPEMLAVLVAGAESATDGPGRVIAVCSAFEQLDRSAPGSHDLVYAAASLHWTDPVGRWERVSRLLRPGGVFAAFGGPVELADSELAAALERARRPFLASDDVPSSDGTAEDAPMQWPGTELQARPLFAEVRQLRLERRLDWTRAEYLGHLGTVSAYLQLAPDARAAALAAIGEALPERIEVAADVTVHLARNVAGAH